VTGRIAVAAQIDPLCSPGAGRWRQCAHPSHSQQCSLLARKKRHVAMINARSFHGIKSSPRRRKEKVGRKSRGDNVAATPRVYGYTRGDNWVRRRLRGLGASALWPSHTRPGPFAVGVGRPAFTTSSKARQMSPPDWKRSKLVTSSYAAPPPVQFRDLSRSTLPASHKLPRLLPPRRTSMITPAPALQIVSDHSHSDSGATFYRPISAINSIDHSDIQ